MKKALVVLLVLIVVLTGLPIMMGMDGMAACSDCGPATLVGACVLAILAAGAALLVIFSGVRIGNRRDALQRLLHNFLLERPPRLV